MIYTKLFFSITIFIITFAIGLLPFIRNSSFSFFKKSEALVSGIFLGTAFFHLLPDASNILTLSHSQHAVILPIILTILSFLFFFAMSNIAGMIKQPLLRPWLIFFVLSFHSIIAGLALGLIHSAHILWLLFIPIIVHKAFDSFALLVVLKKYQLNNKLIIGTIFIFALLTPLAILLGSMTFHSLTNLTANMMTGYFTAILAGSFIYIGFTEGVLYKISIDMGLLLLGVIMMAILSTWT